MDLSIEEIETIIAFVKSFERDEIPDALWDLCMKMCDAVELSRMGFLFM